MPANGSNESEYRKLKAVIRRTVSFRGLNKEALNNFLNNRRGEPQATTPTTATNKPLMTPPPTLVEEDETEGQADPPAPPTTPRRSQTAEQLSASPNEIVIRASFKNSPVFQKQPVEVQNSVLKQREELRIKRQDKLNEVKTSRSSPSKKIDLNETFVKSSPEYTAYHSFEDKCAILIQAAWRGYAARKSELVKSKLQTLKYKKVLLELEKMKKEMQKLKKDQLNLAETTRAKAKYVTSEMRELVAKVAAFPIDKHSAQLSDMRAKNEAAWTRIDNLSAENIHLRQRCQYLEDRCAQLQFKLDLKARSAAHKSIAQAKVSKDLSAEPIDWSEDVNESARGHGAVAEDSVKTANVLRARSVTSVEHYKQTKALSDLNKRIGNDGKEIKTTLRKQVVDKNNEFIRSDEVEGKNPLVSQLNTKVTKDQTRKQNSSPIELSAVNYPVLMKAKSEKPVIAITPLNNYNNIERKTDRPLSQMNVSDSRFKNADEIIHSKRVQRSRSNMSSNEKVIRDLADAEDEAAHKISTPRDYLYDREGSVVSEVTGDKSARSSARRKIIDELPVQGLPVVGNDKRNRTEVVTNFVNKPHSVRAYGSTSRSSTDSIVKNKLIETKLTNSHSDHSSLSKSYDKSGRDTNKQRASNEYTGEEFDQRRVHRRHMQPVEENVNDYDDENEANLNNGFYNRQAVENLVNQSKPKVTQSKIPTLQMVARPGPASPEYTFADTYEKFKAQLRRSESSSSKSAADSSKNKQTSRQSILIRNPSTSRVSELSERPIFPSNGMIQLPPSTPKTKARLSAALGKISPDSTYVIKEPAASSYAVERRPSGRQQSQGRSESPSFTMAEMLNSVKYSNVEPNLIRTGSSAGSAGERNSFLRQSMTINESYEINEISD